MCYNSPEEVRKIASENKSRLLYIMKYLWAMSDENHPVTIADIMTYRDGFDIKTNRKLYVDGRVKSANENIYYILDLLHSAINQGKKRHQ